MYANGRPMVNLKSQNNKISPYKNEVVTIFTCYCLIMNALSHYELMQYQIAFYMLFYRAVKKRQEVMQTGSAVF